MPLRTLYRLLYARFGAQHWWPADSPFEVIVGAILTQNTNWQNVERAIANLRAADALTPQALLRLAPDELQRLIRAAGFFNQKSARLHDFCRWLERDYAGSLEQLFRQSDDALRPLLLARPGIGPETADSILLYAAGRPSFVVDAYTHRLLERIGLQAPQERDYATTRARFMDELPRDAALFNEFHALIVRLAKEHCRKRKPLCPACPLVIRCRTGQAALQGLTDAD